MNLNKQYPLYEGLKIFKKEGKTFTITEMNSLYQLDCLDPISINDMTPSENQKAIFALMYLTEKRDGTCKVKWYIMVNPQVNGYYEKILQVPIFHWKV